MMQLNLLRIFLHHFDVIEKFYITSKSKNENVIKGGQFHFSIFFSILLIEFISFDLSYSIYFIRFIFFLFLNLFYQFILS